MNKLQLLEKVINQFKNHNERLHNHKSLKHHSRKLLCQFNETKKTQFFFIKESDCSLPNMVKKIITTFLNLVTLKIGYKKFH